MNISVVLRTIFFYPLMLIWTLIVGIPLFACALLPASIRYDNKIYYFFLHLLYSGVVYLLRVPLTLKGVESLPKDPALIIVNHQSIFDIPLVGWLLRYYPHIWMYKYELDSVPVFGFLTRRMGIAVDRRSPQRAARALVEALSLMKGKKRHLILFPEGGRFVGGHIHAFLPGFAMLAEKTGRPVVPIYVHDTYKICPPGHIAIGYAPINIVVGPTFFMHANESAEEFTQRVQSWFVKTASAER